MENFFALIIGVGDDLQATIADADAIYKLLIDPNKGSYNPNNVYYLTNEESTKDNILTALDIIIEKTKATNKSTVVIYYSGHGARYINENEVYDYYLKIHGSDKTRKEETMLNGNLFSEKINKIKSEKLLVLLDCCHAAGIKKNELILKGDTSVSNRDLLEKLNSGKGRVFISSCDDYEESVILPKSINSLFTEVALEALNGFLCENEEFVGVIDLIYHVIKEVPKRVAPFHHSQRPIITEVTNLSPDYFVCRNGNFKPFNAATSISKLLANEYLELNMDSCEGGGGSGRSERSNADNIDADFNYNITSWTNKALERSKKLDFIKQYENKIKY